MCIPATQCTYRFIIQQIYIILLFHYWASRHRHIVVVNGLIYTTVVGTDIDDLYSKKNEPNPDRTTMRFLYNTYRYVYNIIEWRTSSSAERKYRTVLRATTEDKKKNNNNKQLSAQNGHDGFHTKGAANNIDEIKTAIEK